MTEKTKEDLEKEVKNLKELIAELEGSAGRPQNGQLEANNQQLRATEQQLQASNQQLAANNQQLRATEQQLQAANQQLAANNQQLRATEQQLRASNQELKTSEELLKKTGALARVGGWEIDLETDTVAWTQMTKIIHEVPDDYVPTLGEAINFFPDAKDELTDAVRRAREDGVPYDLELPFVTATGRKLWVRTVGKPEHQDGTCVRLHGTFQDITDRKQAQDRLAHEHFLLETSQELGHIGTWALDLERNKLEWTDEACRIFGSPEETVTNYEHFLNSVHPDDRDYVHQKWTAAIEGEPYDIEHRILRDGEVLWVREKADIERDDSGKATKAIGFTQDITERRRNEEQLRTILNKSPFPVAVVDTDDEEVVYWSERAKEKFGHTPMMVSEWYEAVYPDPQYREDVIRRWKPFVKKAAESDEPVNAGEYRITCEDGSVKICELYVQLIPDHLIVTLNDITERKLAEDEIQRFQWLLDQETSPAPALEMPAYGDVIELNTERTILDSVGKDMLEELAIDALALLDTSVAVYERNGDYAFGTFVSAWCGIMDNASRERCGTNDNCEALRCGKWLCHENCWNDSAKVAMESGEPTDIECVGGIRLYAVPIRVGNDVIGAVNLGYGTPPTDDETLAELASDYGVDVEQIRKAARAYKPRPPFIIEMAKRRATCMAQTIGEIVERKQAEEEAHTERNRAQQYLDIAPAIIISLDRQGQVTLLNQAGGDILECDPAETVGRDWFDTFIPEPNRAEIRAVFGKLMAGEIESVDYYENLVVTGSGNEKLISWHNTLLYDDKGNATGLLSSGQDITEQNRAAMELARTEERYRLLAENSNDVIYRMTLPEGAYEYVSPSSGKLFGYEPQEFYDNPKLVADMLHPDWHEYFEREWEKLLVGDMPETYEYQIIQKSGEVRWINQRNTLFTDESGAPCSIQGIATDITERKHAEDELRAANLQIQTAVQAGKVGLWDWDLVTNTVRYSPEWKAQVGCTEEEISDSFEEWQNRVHPDDLEQTQAIVEENVTQKAQGYQVEFRLRHKDGSYRWILAQASVLTDDDGNAVRVIGSHVDITELKQAEEALSAAERRSRALLDHSPACHKIVDLDFNLQYMSRNGCRMLKLDENADVCGKPYPFEFFPDTFRQEMTDALNRVKTTGNVQIVEGLANDIAGNEVWLHSTLVPVPDDNGKLDYVTVVSADITGQLQAKRELQRRTMELEKSRALLSDAQSAAGIGCWEYMVAEDKQVWSDEMFRIFGLEVSTKLPGWEGLRSAFPEDWERLDVAVQEAMNGTPYDEEFRIMWPDDSVHWGRTIGTPKRNESGEVDRLVGTVQDITKRKTAELANEAAEARLRKAEKLEAIGQLAGGVAHDFNNMLTIILGRTELLLNGSWTEEKITRNLQSVQEAAERSRELTSQLLAFARKQTIAPEVINVNDVIEGMLKLLRRLIGENLELVWKPSSEVWPVYLDASQVDQILANLCVNARDAIVDTGTITITTENIAVDEWTGQTDEVAEPGDYVVLTVTDDGPGMDKTTQDRVFEPFFTTKDVGQGTGLGLATVYGIVTQNGGIITVDSELGKGTTFNVYLPRHAGEHSEAEDCDAPDVAKGGNEVILICEDESGVLELSEIVLEESGYTLLTASHPDQALAIAAEHAGTIDLLLTDVVMPGMNGRELAKSLMKDNPDLKTLYMSGYTADIIADRGVMEEGMHFISKPFLGDELIRKVRDVLDG